MFKKLCTVKLKQAFLELYRSSRGISIILKDFSYHLEKKVCCTIRILHKIFNLSPKL